MIRICQLQTEICFFISGSSSPVAVEGAGALSATGEEGICFGTSTAALTRVVRLCGSLQGLHPAFLHSPGFVELHLTLLVLLDVSVDPSFSKLPKPATWLTTVRVLEERVRQQDADPRPAHLFNTCFWGMQPADTLQSEWLPFPCAGWQPRMKKPPCLGGHPWLWLTGIHTEVYLPASFGRCAGIWDKHKGQLLLAGMGQWGPRVSGLWKQWAATGAGHGKPAAGCPTWKTFQVHQILTGGWSLA